jgi:hypothetical protein
LTIILHCNRDTCNSWAHHLCLGKKLTKSILVGLMTLSLGLIKILSYKDLCCKSNKFNTEYPNWKGYMCSNKGLIWIPTKTSIQNKRTNFVCAFVRQTICIRQARHRSVSTFVMLFCTCIYKIFIYFSTRKWWCVV